MKLGCSSWSYHAAFRAGRIDQREWLRLCAEEMQLDGVELVDLHFPTTDPQYLRDLKKLCTDLQLTIAGVGVSNDFGPDDRRAAEVDKVRQWTDIAAYLGAPIVRVFAGWVPAPSTGGDAGRIVGLVRKVFGQQTPNTKRLWSDGMWALRQSADYAAERGIVAAVQNNRRDGIVATPADIAQCLRDAGSPWLRLCLDPADLAEPAGIEASLPSVVQVHAKLRDIAGDGGDAQIHWPELLRVLALTPYRGFVLLDYEGIEDPETAVPRAARHMRGLLQLIQRQQLLTSPPDVPDAAPPAADAVETSDVIPIGPASSQA